MPVHNFDPPQGTLESFDLESGALRGNLLDDPTHRRVAVYLTPGAKLSEVRPLVVYLAPYTGSGLKKLGWTAFGESIPQRLDRLVGSGKIGPLAVAFPDCFTSLGGNQYLNNPVFGRWEDFLLEELVPELTRRYPVPAGARGRGVIGYSSGGYGALIQGLRHGSQWGAVVCHSGDMGFENLFRGEFPRLATALAQVGGSIETFWREFQETPKVRGDRFHTLSTLAMCAAYDPDPTQFLGIRLPFDPYTCRLDQERWQHWLEQDPVHMLERPACQASLRRLRLLYLDCGNRDQYHLQYGARQFVSRLQELGIPHDFEEFEDDHLGLDYRLDTSLPRLYQALKG